MIFHRQTTVETPFGMIEIDAELQPILAELWDRGVTTNYSCQGGWMDYPYDIPRFYDAYIAYPAQFDSIVEVVLTRLQVGKLRFEREDPGDYLFPDRNQWSVRFPAVGL